MAAIDRALKKHLVELAGELGLEINPQWKRPQIKNAIVNMEGYDEEMVEDTLLALQQEREREREREEREREREEREKDRIFELEKLKLTMGGTPTPQPLEQNGRKQLPDIRKLVPKFNLQETDVSLFLAIFERQLRALQVEEELWTTQLLAVLPIEVGQIILQESGEDVPEYAVAKRVLLERYRLTPEAFRQKFVLHTRKGTERWKDYAFELQGYLDGWLRGLKVTTFEQLKELMLADQMKRKAGIEAKNQFIDIWGEIISPWVLAEKLDHFELVRPSGRKQNAPIKENWRSANSDLIYRPREIKKPEDRGDRSRQVTEGARNKESAYSSEDKNQGGRGFDFEKRRNLQCFICKSEKHLKAKCPYNDERESRKAEKIERVDTEECNNVELLGETGAGASLKLSPGKVNGMDCSILRDSGASIDLVSQKYVRKKFYTGRYVRVRQALDSETRRLPLARVKLEGDFGFVITEAAVFRRALDRGRYVLGNGTAARIANIGKQKEIVGKSDKRLHDAKRKPKPKLKGAVGPPEVVLRGGREPQYRIEVKRGRSGINRRTESVGRDLRKN